MTQPTTSPTQGAAATTDGAATTGTATTAATGDQATAQQGTAATQATAAATGTAPANGQQAATTNEQGAAAEQGKTFTQADLDRIINDRLDRQDKAFQAKLAAAFGITDPNAAIDPAKALEAAQQQATAARTQANSAMAEALATQAGIKPERVDMFVQLCGLTGALKDVDLNDSSKVREAIKAVVDAKANEFPEWKATATATASGADAGNAGNGKRRYTRAELEGMSQNELAAISEDLIAATREGRIV